jgi:hypothetical protein
MTPSITSNRRRRKRRPLSQKNNNRATWENTATDSINSDLTKEIDMILHRKMDDYAALKKEQFTITEKKKAKRPFEQSVNKGSPVI